MSLPAVLTVSETAKALRVSESFCYEHQRELGGVKVGRHVRFTDVGIARYLETATVGKRGRIKVPTLHFPPATERDAILARVRTIVQEAK
jgi:excisionase family DNA binding protein